MDTGHFPHLECVHFTISKSFGRLYLVPGREGLRLYYVPALSADSTVPGTVTGECDFILPVGSVGGLWSTARAFLQGVESLDENIVIDLDDDSKEFNETSGHNQILVKLYRDKPRGSQGLLNGEEVSWLRIVTGRAEEERRRIKLGAKDLIAIELACQAVISQQFLSTNFDLTIKNNNFNNQKTDNNRSSIGRIIPEPLVQTGLFLSPS
jgi:hypothetical protein